jgi:large subunit ribosomal protein L9
MKLILIQDVPALGSKGDIVDVADGHARNYLLPRKLAVKVTPGAEKSAERVRKARLEAARRARDEAELVAQALVGKRIVVAARSADEGRLFGSIGVRDIVEAIRKFTGVEVPAQHIDLRFPIKEIGLHEVRVRPHPEVEFQLMLDVIPA